MALNKFSSSPSDRDNNNEYEATSDRDGKNDEVRDLKLEIFRLKEANLELEQLRLEVSSLNHLKLKLERKETLIEKLEGDIGNLSDENKRHFVFNKLEAERKNAEIVRLKKIVTEMEEEKENILDKVIY